MSTALDVDWDAIKKGAMSGMSYRQLGELHGLKWTTIAKRADRQGWKTSNAAAALTKRVIGDEKLRSRTIEKTAERVGVSLAGAVTELVSHAVQQGRQIMDRAHAIAMSADSPADMKNATIAWGIAHQHSRLAMGLDRADAGRDPIISVAQGGPIQPSKAIDIPSVTENVPRGTPEKPNDGHKTD